MILPYNKLGYPFIEPIRMTGLIPRASTIAHHLIVELMMGMIKTGRSSHPIPGGI